MLRPSQKTAARAVLAVFIIAACGRSQVFPRRFPDGGPIVGSSGTGGGLGGSGEGGGSAAGGGSGVGGGGGLLSCTPANCSDGCCQGTTCVHFVNQGPSVCGLYAQACKACQPGGACSLGTCRSIPCNAQTCNGCCNTDICNPGVLSGVCGSNFCTGCPNGTACLNQKCTPTTVLVGDPCTSNSQCAGLGVGAFCKLTTTSGSAIYEGGFCTLPCYGAPSCPTASGPNGGGTHCLQLASGFGEADVICSQECGGAFPACRPGYACNQSVGNAKVCWISPLPFVDAGTTLVGSPCNSNAECAGLSGGFCIQDMSPTFGNTGYRGGYCSANCNGTCPSGVCVAETFPSPVGPLTASTCKSRCTGKGLSNCRIGYTCFPLGIGDDGWCGPNCANGGIACPPGKVCNPASGYCI